MKILILAILIIPSAVFARLGETIEQCKERYGEPIITKGDKEVVVVNFKKSGINIVCMFRKNVCVRILFEKDDKSEFSIEQIQLLLKSNGGGWITSHLISRDECKEWENENEDRAICPIESDMLYIMSKEEAARTMAETKTKEDKKLEGF